MTKYMKKLSIHNRKWFWAMAAVAGLSVICIRQVYGDYSTEHCNRIEININQPEALPLLQKTDVMGWLDSQQQLLGMPVESIKLSKLEEKLKQRPEIKSCDLRMDYRGTLTVDVEPYIPIARILIDNADDYYVSAEGVFFPTSPNYTARVLLLTGTFFGGKRTLNERKSANLLAFLNRITEDEFWKAQLTQLDVDDQQQMQAIPLLGNHTVLFGKPEDTEEKLKRLKIFYQQIFPVKGWDNYSEINVAFAHQVVCK